MPEYVNKDYYRQLAPDDRSFLNLSAQNIRNVMDRLNAENIMFSATVGYKNTITVSKADRERALAIVNSLSDQNRSTARIIGNVPYKELPPSERKYIAGRKYHCRGFIYEILWQNKRQQCNSYGSG